MAGTFEDLPQSAAHVRVVVHDDDPSHVEVLFWRVVFSVCPSVVARVDRGCR
jgi:hypothetical protein